MITNGMLERYLRRILAQPVRVKLFTSISMPAGIGVSEPAIVEVEGGGYRSVVLTAADWKITSTPNVFAEAGVQEFRFDGSKRIDIWGSYIVQESDGAVLMIKRFDGLQDIRRNGDIVPVLPIFKLAGFTGASV